MRARFLSHTPYAESEFEMQLVPGFAPRKSGVAAGRFNGAVCDGCRGRKRGETCRSPTGYACQKRRTVTGTVPFSTLLDEFVDEVGEQPFVSRVAHLLGGSREIFLNGSHRHRYESLWNAQSEDSDSDARCAAIYLLTSSPFLWCKSYGAVKPDFIDFTAIRIHGVDLDGYVLYHTAKDLYKGTNRITISELTDPELVSDEAFRLVIMAFLIRRYGTEILKAGEAEGYR